jgi:hypothetical protein
MTGARHVLVALILTATAAFVVGVVIERHQASTEAAETPAQRGAEHATGATEGTETSETTASPSREPATEPSESSEKLFGVDPEGTGLLAVAVAVSLLLAAGVWWRGASPLVLGVVALAMAAFGALDVREAIHQADESRTGLMVLAVAVAVLHLAAALLAARTTAAARGAGPPAASARST